MSESRSPRASISDVAEAAQVSPMTVSRVINGHSSIRDTTRERVLAAMARLDYTPNRAAQTLASRKSDRIGVIVDSAVEFGPGSTLRGIEIAANEAGYAVSSVSIVGGQATDAAHAVESMLGQRVDALCIIAPRASSIDLLRAAHRGTPTVVLASQPDETFVTASVDQGHGVRLALGHLIELGHREIVHVGGPADWLDATARADAYCEAMRESGLSPRVVSRGGWNADAGHEFASTAPIDFTAVLAANDQIALGLLHGFADRGVRVPADVSIVGFDDIPESRHFVPPLTTVRQDFAALGSAAVDALLGVLRGDGPQERPRILPTLVERASTAAPASR